MTPADIIAKLFSEKSVTVARIEKAKGAALRHRLTWETVTAAMTDEQRKAITDAS